MRRSRSPFKSNRPFGMSISSIIAIQLSCSSILHTLSLNPSFAPRLRVQTSFLSHLQSRIPSCTRETLTLQMVYAPPGSGYYRPEDETGALPQTYDPLMEYPGTMRPGRTKENQPYSSLPISDTDPDPVPWPHFQEIEWHHQWTPPHEHPIPMEDFIEMEGRWASAEVEAEMRVGARRGVRERRELEELQKSSSNFILDDDDDDDDDDEGDSPRLDIGEGVELLIGSKASTTEAKKGKASTKTSTPFTETEDEDDFLLDLGLDVLDVDVKGAVGGRAFTEDGGEDVSTSQTMEDEVALDMKFDDFDLDFTEESTDADDINIAGDLDVDGAEEDVQLDEYVGNEDLADDDSFDDGGYDVGYDFNDYDSGGGSDNFS